MDQAGIDAFKAFREFSRLTGERKGSPPRRRSPTRLEIDGPVFERWLLKTAINASCLSPVDRKWLATAEPIRITPSTLVRQVFGLDPISDPLGVYACGAVGQQYAFEESVALSAFYLPVGNSVIGYLFEFYGFRFVLNCTRVGLPNPLRMPGNKASAWRTSELTYRLGYVKYNVGRFPSHYISFGWPDRPLPSWAWQRI